MASAHGALHEMVVTGFKRRVRIVAPANGSERFCSGDCAPIVGVKGGDIGSRSFAASQSSSANFGDVCQHLYSHTTRSAF